MYTRARESLDGDSFYHVYQEALNECFNHKLEAAVRILAWEGYMKTIVYVESVEAAKQLATKLQKQYGQE